MVPPTIAAIATSTGSGGIGIIRISGTSAFSIGTSIFRHHSSKDKSSKLNSTDIQSHFFYYGYIFDSSIERIIDEVLVVFMKSPKTYTREDVVEIHAHASSYALKAILELILKNGAIPAQPGEFTKRAYLNGRIDLTQSEAIIEIINAQSELAVQSAANQIFGGIREIINNLREALLQILTQLEAVIDFPEDVEDLLNTNVLLDHIESNIQAPIKTLINVYKEKSFIRDGIKIVIAGAPNVGKSSILNQMLQKETAIVTSIPGTTRDLIKEHLVLNNIHTQILDTAGIRETEDPVESIGVQRAKEQIDIADIILFIIQANTIVSKEDELVYQCVQNKNIIIVINKSDLVNTDYKSPIPEHWRHHPSVLISALYGHGCDQLKNLITDKFLNRIDNNNDFVLPNIRHKILLEKCLESVSTFKTGVEGKTPYDLLTLDIQEAVNALNEIIGVNVSPDVLDRIFDSFCIGK